MRVYHEGGQGIINFFIDFVSDYGEDIESGEDRVSEIDIVAEVEGSVVGALQRIGCSDDTASGL